MDALNTALPDEVAFGVDRNTAFYHLLDTYGRAEPVKLGETLRVRN